jgi:hypothetical protein
VVTVREGEALVGVAGGAQQVLPGQAARVTGSDPTDADVRNGIGIDGFDAWSADRDRRYERSRSSAYVSRQMVGYADLDEHGNWQSYPDYGAVWFPATVAAGWAPYRDGYWANIGGWGYTWIDSAPWGYAPYHYGRWVWIGGRWGWAPGAYVARPVWAPALVAWFGGAGWGLSVSSGAPVYGWVPLGWGEPYLPWWKRCSHTCWTHYNRPYKVDVTVRPSAPPPMPRHVHFGVPGAVTAVPQATLVNRRPVGSNLVPVPVSGAAPPPAMVGAPSVAPGRAPVPRPQPGVGAAPPPASSFVPPPRDPSRGPGGSPPRTERPAGGPGAIPPAAPAAPAAPSSGTLPAAPPPKTPGAPAGTAPSAPATTMPPAAAPSPQPPRGRPRDGQPPTPHAGPAAPPPTVQAPRPIESPLPAPVPSARPSAPPAPAPAPAVRPSPPPVSGPAPSPAPRAAQRPAPPAPAPAARPSPAPASGPAPSSAPGAAQRPAPPAGAAQPPQQGGGRGGQRDGDMGLKPPRGGDKAEPKPETPSGSGPK